MKEAASRVPDQPGALWLRWESPPQAGAEQADKGRERAETLFAELREVPPERRGQVLKGRRFRDPALVELLLEKSREAQPANPELADTLAMIAAMLAVHLQGRDRGSPLVAIFLGRANCLSANARRLMGCEAEAEQAFANTVTFLARSAGSCDRAFYCRSLALLRWEQGRIDEAVSLLHHAARIFGESQAARHEEGTTLALLGLLYTEEGDERRATPLLRRARSAAASERRFWLAARARLALALGEALTGHPDKARWARREAWELYPKLDDSRELVRAHWLEGRVCSLLGPTDEAETLLDATRLRFLDERRLPEASLATLDLALHRAESKREQEVEALVEDLERRLGAEEGSDIGLRGLRRFQRALAEGAELRESAAGLASYLRRTFRFRGFRVEPLPFA